MRCILPLLRLLLLALAIPLPLLAAAPLAAEPTQDAQEEAAGQDENLVYDDWHVLKVAGADSGYMHSRVTRAGTADAPLFEVYIESAMKMNRLGAVVDVTSWQRSTERADGSFVRVESSLNMSNRPTRTEVTFEDDVATVRTTVMGAVREKEVEISEDCLGPYWLAKSVLEREDEPGASYELTTWSAESNGPAKVRIEVVGREDVIVQGSKRSLLRYESTLESMGITQSTWVDDEGFALKTSTPMMGMTIETVLTDEASARAAYANGGELSPDVFTQSVVVADHHLPASRSVSRAQLEIRPRSGSIELEGLADGRQSVIERRDDGGVTIEIVRRVPAKAHDAPRPPADLPEDLRECLEPSSMIQSDHPDIVRIANEVTGDTADAWKAAQRLETWVEANITEKNMDVGFASALEVCTDRAGDCTEHAVLMCALARASGIPSRVAMGLLYIGGIWGGHAWTEVWIDGDWYALDGTVGTGSVDALHLTIVRLPLAEGSPMTDFAGLLEVIGKVDIDVRSLTYGEHTVDMSRDDIVTIANGRYTDRAWQLAFGVRDGWEIEQREPSTRIGFELLEIEGRCEDGKKVAIEVHALDRSYTSIVESLLGVAEGTLVRAASSGDELDADLVAIAIDGRRAWYLDEGGIVRVRRRLAVEAGERWFLFELSRVNGEAQKKLFDELVRSIDLDAGN